MQLNGLWTRCGLSTRPNSRARPDGTSVRQAAESWFSDVVEKCRVIHPAFFLRFSPHPSWPSITALHRYSTVSDWDLAPNALSFVSIRLIEGYYRTVAASADLFHGLVLAATSFAASGLCGPVACWPGLDSFTAFSSVDKTKVIHATDLIDNSGPGTKFTRGKSFAARRTRSARRPCGQTS